MAAKAKQNWRYSSPIAVISDARADILDTIYNWLNNVGGVGDEYHNGATRVPDAGSAWTALREQDTGTTVALRLQPPTTSLRKHQRVLIYGRDDISVETPTHTGSDVKLDGRIFAAHVKFVTHGNEADYTTFDAATPYTGADWTAFCGVVLATSILTHIEILEGEEAISIWFRTNTNTMHMMLGGDIWDGYGEAPAESDGGIYGIATSGYTTVISTTFNAISPQNGTVLAGNNTGAGASKTLTYTPGGAVLALSAREPLFNMGTAPNISGNLRMRFPMSNQVANVLLGQVRGIYIVADTLSGTVLQPAAVPLAYIMGYGTVGVADCIAFEH